MGLAEGVRVRLDKGLNGAWLAEIEKVKTGRTGRGRAFSLIGMVVKNVRAASAASLHLQAFAGCHGQVFGKGLPQSVLGHRKISLACN